MKGVCEILKSTSVQWAGRGCLLLVLFAAAGGLAQTTNMPAGDGAGKPLGISIEALCKGKRLQDGASVQAPAVIYIFPHLESAEKPHAGDKVAIDLFANDQKLCSKEAVWQEEKRPSHRPGEAVPLWVMPAQFLVSDCVWSNPAPGSYTLTAHATGLHGLSAAAEPLHVSVVSPAVR